METAVPIPMSSLRMTKKALRLRDGEGAGKRSQRKIRSSRASSVGVAKSLATLGMKKGIELARELFRPLWLVNGDAPGSGRPWKEVERKAGEGCGSCLCVGCSQRDIALNSPAFYPGTLWPHHLWD